MAFILDHRVIRVFTEVPDKLQAFLCCIPIRFRIPYFIYIFFFVTLVTLSQGAEIKEGRAIVVLCGLH